MLAMLPIVWLSVYLTTLGIIIGSICALALIAVYALLIIQRLHDLNLSAWLTLVGLIPYVNFIFIALISILPGTKDGNRFGLRPPPNTLWHWVGAAALVMGFGLSFGVALWTALEFYLTQPTQ